MPDLPPRSTPKERRGTPETTDPRWVWGPNANEGEVAPFLLQGKRIGPYVLQSHVGRGGFGSVFQAWDPRLKRAVAVKVLTRTHERAVRRFQREMETLARLRHPGIVTLHSGGEADGHPYIVMDLIEGESLEAWCEPDRLLSLRRATEIVRDVAIAISYAHGEGVLHRDLKPTNVLIDPEGKPRVVDFGLAFLQEEGARLSKTGAAVGTPAFMAPEQAAGETPDERTDVYGLGATLYTLLTGLPPIEGGVPEFLLAVQRQDPKPPSRHRPQISADLDRVCLRCLAKNPARRFQSAADLVDALDALLAGDFRPGPFGRAAIVGGLVVLIGLGVVALGAALWVGPRASPPAPITQPAGEDEQVDGPAEVERLLSRADELGRQHEDLQPALEVFEEARSLAEGDGRALLVRVLLARAKLYQRRARYGAGLADVDEVLTDPGPLEKEATTLRSRCLEGLGRIEEAQAGWRRLWEEDPEGLTGLAAGVEMAISDDDFRLAATRARRVLERDPNHFESRLNLFYSLLRERHVDECSSHLGVALSQRPLDPRAHIAKASLAGERGKMEASLAAVNRAISLMPGPHPLTCALRAKILNDLGRYEEARRDIEFALERRPDKALDLLLQRGFSWYDQGLRELDKSLWAKAAEDWRRAHDLDAAGFAKEVEYAYPPAYRRPMRRAARGQPPGPPGMD